MKRIPIQKKLLSLLPLLFLFLILLFPTQARNGASSGLLLWFNVLLPTLLPFMILSDLIRRLHIIDTLCNRIASRTGRNLYFLYPLLLGLLCGSLRIEFPPILGNVFVVKVEEIHVFRGVGHLRMMTYHGDFLLAADLLEACEHLLP